MSQGEEPGIIARWICLAAGVSERPSLASVFKNGLPAWRKECRVRILEA
jgi:hypothetical protein